MVFDVFTTLKL